MIFIPGNIPSLKNSKVATGKGVFMSKTCRLYLQSQGIKRYSAARKEVDEYKTRRNVFRESIGEIFHGVEYPVIMGCHFVRDSKRKFDFINACQIFFDLLTAHGFIHDDDMDHLIPTPMLMGGRWYTVDKAQPGVWIKIIGRENFE